METKKEFCDHCGECFSVENLKPYASVPWNTDSTNKGESSVLCFDCISDFKCEERLKQK